MLLSPAVVTILHMHIPLSRGPASGVGEHRQDREAGRLVYPVISRRSGGLSLGINLFPEAKVCGFDCPYCEIFTAAQDTRDAGQGPGVQDLEAELDAFLDGAYRDSWAPEPIRDLCLSGNGEPTSSPVLEEALELCARLQAARPGLLGASALVLITNSTGFLDAGISSLLERFVRTQGLVVWAKLDAGNERLFRLMSGAGSSSAPTLEGIAKGLLSFARLSPIVIQTMLCRVAGRAPSAGDLEDYASLLSRLVRGGARISEVHLYTFARPSPGESCAPLADEELRRCAALVRGATALPVRAFGFRDELS